MKYDYLPKRNGRRPPAARMAGGIPGETRYPHHIYAIVENSSWGEQHLSGNISRREIAPMAAWIWQGMCGNGWQIGTAGVIMLVRHRETQPAHLLERIGFYGAALGTSTITTFAPPTVSQRFQRIPTTASVFVVLYKQDLRDEICITFYGIPLIRKIRCLL